MITMREDGEGSGSGEGEGFIEDQHPSTLMHHYPDDDFSDRHSSSSSTTGPYECSTPSGGSSPYNMSPWHQSMPSIPPYISSSWSQSTADPSDQASAVVPRTELICSLVREEGHIYSLVAVGDLLYTGSDSKNIRVWKNQKDYAGFKSGSGFVKAIVVAAERIFTGHQDGKIRVWKVSPKNPTVHKRIGSLPKLKDVFRSSFKPSSYVEVRRHRSALWIRHTDAISCLSLNEDQGLLYSGSWDKTFKVWRISDSRCLESVVAHGDTVNAVVAAFGGSVFTGSADGTVKLWRREMLPKATKHVLVETLLKQECAVTSIAVSPTAPVVYCGSSDGLINFWEGERHPSHGGVLRSHNMAVLCIVAAGSLVLSGSADTTICVWLRDGGVHTCLAVLSGHTGPVKCLAIGKEAADSKEESRGGGGGGGGGDGETARWILYSGSLDKSLKVWRVTEPAAEALMRRPQHMPTDSGGESDVFGRSNFA